MGKNRLEAFSDGVIAILITIMVLELRVPEGGDFDALRQVFRHLLTYVMSFVYLRPGRKGDSLGCALRCRARSCVRQSAVFGCDFRFRRGDVAGSRPANRISNQSADERVTPR